ncbi:hypothetical protein BDQ12DRAFT_626230 [Crucibulum laeve]|uniref:Uncharacterized protein n=1 Tax=Crucibulum laeve TaxID=68775 RepID=A0A5C3M879_9AGAR|nr:hypothetical protein BDQ12DRAFT_626230 [Crucibulum laeve]
MSQSRPLLGPSLSFSGTTTPLPRPPKRRLVSTSELEFFAPAASSFQPRPYAPGLQTSQSRSRALSTSRGARTHEALALPPAGMDPQPSDPNVIFIHPPFTTFPQSQLYPDGLTYPLMAENMEWFLDATDFSSESNTNPHAIPYPPHLEPPRGWCPAKKKDLKERGSEGWPEGEEPRLRCTFCRRTYAGVNAKSMWRRHVFEKHKIAMSNRRDGSDRPRGRGSGKENRQTTSRSRDESHDRLVTMAVTPQTAPENVSHKSRFRSLVSVEDMRPRRDRLKVKEKMAPPAAPRISQEEFAPPPESSRRDSSEPCKQSPPLSPPLTPNPSSDPANALTESSDTPSLRSPRAGPSTIPPSPYDPLLTPSFRHSPPRLPSDQPWRFSPSHPMHSQTRELTLSMLARETASPLTKASRAIDASPFQLQCSPTASPGIGKLYLTGFDTPASAARLPAQSRKIFFRGALPSPMSGRLNNESGKYRIEASPLARTPGMMNGHRKSLSGFSDDWLSSPARLPLDPNELLTNSNDPFVAMYQPWTPLSIKTGRSHEQGSAAKAVLEAESPVLRNSTLPTGVGLGIGLLEPFTLPKVESPMESDDFDLYSADAEEQENKLDGDNSVVIQEPAASDNDEFSPPLKKRKTCADSRG